LRAHEFGPLRIGQLQCIPLGMFARGFAPGHTSFQPALGVDEIMLTGGRGLLLLWPAFINLSGLATSKFWAAKLWRRGSAGIFCLSAPRRC